MKFSRAVEYAIRASLQLARCDGEMPVPCRKLARDGEMPERFLLQILRSLVLQDVLTSTRGVDGGYQLKNTPDQTSLLQVIEAIEGQLTPTQIASPGLSSETVEAIHRELESVVQQTRTTLDEIKLSRLIQC